MQITITDAEDRLPELMSRAEAGEEIILTRDGNPVVRLVPTKLAQNREQLRKVLDDDGFPA